MKTAGLKYLNNMTKSLLIITILSFIMAISSIILTDVYPSKYSVLIGIFIGYSVGIIYAKHSK